MIEEGVEFSVGTLFYNPHMRLCRSFFSLAVSATPISSILDAFCSTGIRGIRYANENRSVGEVVFLDSCKLAVETALSNASFHGIASLGVVGRFENLISNAPKTDLVELDPFGSPSKFLDPLFRAMEGRRRFFASITATDVMVLCGPHSSACFKNYQSRQCNNDFTHETGLRILLKKIFYTSAQYNFYIKPLVSLSHRHYLKTFILVERGSKGISSSEDNVGFVRFCRLCGFRKLGLDPLPCGHSHQQLIGPLWIGHLHSKDHLSLMRSENNRRNYSDSIEIDSLLSRMEDELFLPPYFYTMGSIGKYLKLSKTPSINSLISILKDAGFNASRTHFNKNAIKTDADIEKIRKEIKKIK